jgi:hypothetical protein
MAMDDQVTPRQFIVFLFMLGMSGVLVSIYWYWSFGAGPVAWGLAFVRFVKLLLPVPMPAPVAMEHRSDAAERDGNGAELGSGTSFRSVVEYLEQCDDDMLLDILAQLAGADGDYRFAESRVAKFIPGRVEDRLAQVRAVRDTPPPPGRQLRVRDAEGERLIPMDA